MAVSDSEEQKRKKNGGRKIGAKSRMARAGISLTIFHPKG